METISNVGKVIADLGDVFFGNQATPVIDGSINYNTGDIDISHIKLTTGQNWATSISKGDPDISFSLGATDAATNAMIMQGCNQERGCCYQDGTRYHSQRLQRWYYRQVD